MSGRGGPARGRGGRARGRGAPVSSCRAPLIPGRCAAALVLVVSACGSPPPTSAFGAAPAPEPTPAPPAPAAAPAPAAPRRVAVVEDPEATTLAAAVVVPGSAWELPGTEGLTILSALTLLEEIRPGLDSLDARAHVTCGLPTFTFTLVAAREVWRPALVRFLDGLFRPSPGNAALARARDRLAASLTLDQASPAWQARLAVRRALHADTMSSGWLGPACGVPETLALFDLSDVRTAAHRFAPRMAHVAALTPGEADAVEALLTARIPDGPAPVVPAPRTVRPGRRHVERNTVTSWIAVAFPFGPGADTEAIRLLGAVLEDAIAPSVDRPESLTAGHELERHGAGGTLVVRAVTTPGAAADYTDRPESLATRFAVTGVPTPVLERVARRHRGLRLRQLATPEARAAAMALELALGGTPAPWPDLDITGDRVRAAAEALGVPARAVVGPRVEGEGTRP